MIDRLLIAMQERGLLLSDREIDAFSEAQSFLHNQDIVDALWLASKIGGAYEVVKADEPKDKTDELEDKADEPEDKTDSIAPNTSTRGIDDPNSRLVIPPSVPLIPKSGGDQDSQPQEVPEKGLPIQVQSAPALPDTRSIARSLRPLMRKVPSLNRVELDEMATVNRIAERDIWVPILKRSPERWFDLELVVEASEFSFIWQDTINEFQHLLENQGAFRNVRTWNVRVSEAGKPRLEVKKQRNVEVESGFSSRSPKELIDASGRCLVLYISDCRSQIWQQGQIHDWLALWSKHCPTTIVQLLPERLWRQSELDVGFAVQAGSLIPGAVNSQLQVREIGVRTQIAPANALTLPIVTLTANALKQWALVVAAAGRQRVPARLFDLSWVKDPERDRTASIIRPKSAEARVELFMATASVAAQKLAEMMAAVPVEMSVVRLIQQELLPDLTPVHIAEVYSSDLLEEERQPTADLPIRYDFAKGVRGLLNERTPLDETFKVIEALSKRIARTLGFEIDSFTALLSPKSDWTLEQKNAILPFAQVTTEVLHRLGGDYAELAQLVERDASRRSDWIKPFTPDDDPKFPKLEALTFTTAQLVEAETGWPPLQVEEYTVATITFDPHAQSTLEVEPFTFKIGTLVRSRNFREWGDYREVWGGYWEVQKSDGQAYRYIEQIDENITLEMVGIKGGEFMMGSLAEEPESNERPQHLVTVPDFYLGRYPVTQAQWRLVAAMPQEKRELDLGPSNFKGDTRPVEQVSWEDAIEFCVRLSKHTKRQYRLPTEAEWEYACRAGTTTPFHFGETISTELANYNGSAYAYANGSTGKSRDETTSLDHFEIANAWGLCDMHGNVWEWCEDHWHNNYNGASENGIAWLTDDAGSLRVVRGGSWFNYPKYCRSAFRYCSDPSGRDLSIGFRLACAAPGLV
jgi:formylglycine-generating enzyme required for sulfatase activity